MGRVAKYKKIKSCDPFSSKNGGKQSMTGVWGMDDNGRRAKKRSKTSVALRKKRKRAIDSTTGDDAFDVPPSGGDDFDLSDLLSVKKIKPPVQVLLEETTTATERTVVAAAMSTKHEGGSSDCEEEDTAIPSNKEIVPDPMVEEKRAARILKIEPEQEARSKNAPKVERLAGESRKAFQKRIKSETRQIIKNEKLQERNPEKRQRKKEFLNKKKSKAKAKSNRVTTYDSDDAFEKHKAETSNDGFITGEQAVARVAFGDQVERPPVFEQLPRGAEAKMPAKSKSANGNVNIQAEQQAMESMRRKVQAQYALVKAKRRKAGDFHL